MSANNTIQSSALPVGHTLRDYTITALLGQGGFGITYLAKEDLTDYTVVIKENFPYEFADRHLPNLTVIPRPGHDENYRWSLESFVKEACTLRALPEHNNIVRIMAVFKEMNTAYIVMKSVDGQNLDRLYPEGTMIGKSNLLHLLHKLLPALSHLHSHGVIHRDIKPANIMFTSAGEPVIIDFGAARPKNVKTVTIIGTIGYAPPEQLDQTKNAPQPNWDIHALGATCYRLITGEDPIYVPNRLASNNQLCSIYGAELLRSIDRARELEAANRWQSAQEWLDALNAATGTFPGTQLPTIHQPQTVSPPQQTAPTLQEARRLLQEQNISQDEYDAKLRECSEKGEAELVSLLIAAGANVNKADKYGWTPLCNAAHKGRTECVRLLLAAPGIDVNKAEKDGETPLYRAACNGHTECVKLLLAAPGIDVNKADNDGWTPLKVAENHDETECARLIREAGGKAETERKAREEAERKRQAKADYSMGCNYYFGNNGYSVDYGKAVEYFRKAAEQGQADAQNNLGVCYESGRGVTKDYQEAVRWYRKAAEQGQADAQNNLGGCYANGRGVTQDYNEAVRWYRKAAEQGYAGAQNDLGWCYENGRGVTQDYQEAVRWYRKAAEQGYAIAQSNLGLCYANGRGVTQDYNEAVRWYRK
ncbi:MAG: ankyrin repeat domain-containing protein, partial [Akkermansia sp.]|nr:ankyrin repeat domain-containing protein [Akkermansia sp.]